MNRLSGEEYHGHLSLSQRAFFPPVLALADGPPLEDQGFAIQPTFQTYHADFGSTGSKDPFERCRGALLTARNQIARLNPGMIMTDRILDTPQPCSQALLGERRRHPAQDPSFCSFPCKVNGPPSAGRVP